MTQIKKRDVAIGVVGAAALGVTAKAGGRFAFGIKTAVSQGGSPWGGAINWMVARRGPVKFGIAQTFKGKLPAALTTMHAEAAVRAMENKIFYLGEKQVAKKIKIGYDNGPDAFRHTMGSALITERLMSKGKHPMDAEDALAFLAAAGNSHEGDSFLHLFDTTHYKYSGMMDVHNNWVGAHRAVLLHEQLASRGADEIAAMASEEMSKLPQGVRDALEAYSPREQLLFADILGAIASPVDDAVRFDLQALKAAHKPVSMTELSAAQYAAAGQVKPDIGIHQVPHAASFDDIYRLGSDGATVEVRTDVPHASGFPQPFVDGKYVKGMKRVKMDLGGYLAKRPPNETGAA